MGRAEYKDIYIEEKLAEIRRMVKRNWLSLEKKQQQKTDKIMRTVIKDIIEKESDKKDEHDYVERLLPIKSENEAAKIKETLTLYYCALYNDNLELLQDLLREDFKFGEINTLSLSVLDKRISKEFKKEDYIKLVKKDSYSFDRFISSISDCSKKHQEELIKSFCDIIKKDPSTIGIGNNIAILTKDTIQIFGEETILLSTKKQRKNILSHYFFPKKKKNQIMLNYMVKKYRTFDEVLFRYDMLFDNLTEEELLKTDCNRESLYQLAITSGNLERVRNLIKENEKFYLPYNLMRIETLEILSDDTLLRLNEDKEFRKQFSAISYVEETEVPKLLQKIEKSNKGLKNKIFKKQRKTV